jgi:hypothetical protein
MATLAAAIGIPAAVALYGAMKAEEARAAQFGPVADPGTQKALDAEKQKRIAAEAREAKLLADLASEQGKRSKLERRSALSMAAEDAFRRASPDVLATAATGVIGVWGVTNPRVVDALQAPAKNYIRRGTLWELYGVTRQAESVPQAGGAEKRKAEEADGEAKRAKLEDEAGDVDNGSPTPSTTASTTASNVGSVATTPASTPALGPTPAPKNSPPAVASMAPAPAPAVSSPPPPDVTPSSNPFDAPASASAYVPGTVAPPPQPAAASSSPLPDFPEDDGSSAAPSSSPAASDIPPPDEFTPIPEEAPTQSGMPAISTFLPSLGGPSTPPTPIRDMGYEAFAGEWLTQINAAKGTVIKGKEDTQEQEKLTRSNEEASRLAKALEESLTKAKAKMDADRPKIDKMYASLPADRRAEVDPMNDKLSKAINRTNALIVAAKGVQTAEQWQAMEEMYPGWRWAKQDLETALTNFSNEVTKRVPLSERLFGKKAAPAPAPAPPAAPLFTGVIDTSTPGAPAAAPAPAPEAAPAPVEDPRTSIHRDILVGSARAIQELDQQIAATKKVWNDAKAAREALCSMWGGKLSDYKGGPEEYEKVTQLLSTGEDALDTLTALRDAWVDFLGRYKRETDGIAFVSNDSFEAPAATQSIQTGGVIKPLVLLRSEYKKLVEMKAEGVPDITPGLLRTTQKLQAIRQRGRMSDLERVAEENERKIREEIRTQNKLPNLKLDCYPYRRKRELTAADAVAAAPFFTGVSDTSTPGAPVVVAAPTPNPELTVAEQNALVSAESEASYAKWVGEASQRAASAATIDTDTYDHLPAEEQAKWQYEPSKPNGYTGRGEDEPYYRRKTPSAVAAAPAPPSPEAIAKARQERLQRNAAATTAAAAAAAAAEVLAEDDAVFAEAAKDPRWKPADLKGIRDVVVGNKIMTVFTRIIDDYAHRREGRGSLSDLLGALGDLSGKLKDPESGEVIQSMLDQVKNAIDTKQREDARWEEKEEKATAAAVAEAADPNVQRISSDVYAKLTPEQRVGWEWEHGERPWDPAEYVRKPVGATEPPGPPTSLAFSRGAAPAPAGWQNAATLFKEAGKSALAVRIAKLAHMYPSTDKSEVARRIVAILRRYPRREWTSVLTGLETARRKVFRGEIPTPPWKETAEVLAQIQSPTPEPQGDGEGEATRAPDTDAEFNQIMEEIDGSPATGATSAVNRPLGEDVDVEAELAALGNTDRVAALDQELEAELAEPTAATPLPFSAPPPAAPAPAPAAVVVPPPMPTAAASPENQMPSTAAVPAVSAASPPPAPAPAPAAASPPPAPARSRRTSLGAPLGQLSPTQLASLYAPPEGRVRRSSASSSSENTVTPNEEGEFSGLSPLWARRKAAAAAKAASSPLSNKEIADIKKKITELKRVLKEAKNMSNAQAYELKLPEKKEELRFLEEQLQTVPRSPLWRRGGTRKRTLRTRRGVNKRNVRRTRRSKNRANRTHKNSR